MQVGNNMNKAEFVASKNAECSLIKWRVRVKSYEWRIRDTHKYKWRFLVTYTFDSLLEAHV